MSLTAIALLFSALASAEDAVVLKDNQQSFNQRWFSRIEGDTLQVKERQNADASWITLVLPEGLMPPAAISSDDIYIIALDEDRRIYTMFGGLEDTPEDFSWIDRWGHPFWYGKGMKMPADTVDWEISFLSPDTDKHLLYLAGAREWDSDGWPMLGPEPEYLRRRVGQGVTTIYALRADRKRITLVDPWLPLDESYEICGPSRGTTAMAALSASGSIVFVAAEDGTLYSRRTDFDIQGSDEFFFNYTWAPLEPDGRFSRLPLLNRWTYRPLPQEPWRKHAPPPGVYTDRVSIHKTGTGGMHAQLRMAGQQESQSGYWFKDIQDKPWQFQPTAEPLQGRSLPLKAGQRSHAASAEEFRFSAGSQFYRPWIPLIKRTAVDIPVRVTDFHPHCSPAKLRFTLPSGEEVQASLHHAQNLRLSPRAAGLDEEPIEFLGGIEPLNKTELSDEGLAFVAEYFGEQKISPTVFEVSDSELTLDKKSGFGNGVRFDLRIQLEVPPVQAVPAPHHQDAFLQLVEGQSKPTEAEQAYATQFQYVFVAGILNEIIGGYLVENSRALQRMGVDKSDIHIINPPSDKSVEDNSIWLMGKLKEIVLGSSKPVVIIGHSKGCAESLLAAVQNLDFTKEHVRALVLIQGALLGSPITEDLADSKGLPEPPGTTNRQWTKIYELTKTSTRTGLQGMLKRGLGSIRRDESIARWKRIEATHPGALQALSDRIFYLRTHKDVQDLTLVLKMTGHWLHAHYGRSDGMMLIDDQRLEGIGRDMLIMSGADHSDLTVSAMTSTRPSSWRSAAMALIVRELHRDATTASDPQP